MVWLLVEVALVVVDVSVLLKEVELMDVQAGERRSEVLMLDVFVIG